LPSLLCSSYGRLIDDFDSTDHLSLCRVLADVPNLVPSHPTTFWITHEEATPSHVELSITLRTSQADVERMLFNTLSEWLLAVSKDEWIKSECWRRKHGIEDSIAAETEVSSPFPAFCVEAYLIHSTSRPVIPTGLQHGTLCPP
jgi:hypothetical protein